MVCDTLSAGMVYNGKNWTNSTQLEYWNKVKDKELANEKMKQFLEAVYTQVSKEGIDKVINKNNLKKLYEQYTKS